MGPQPSLWPPFAARWGDAAAAAAPEPRGSGGDFPFPVPETPKCLRSAQENEEPCALSLFDPHLYLFICFFLSCLLACLLAQIPAVFMGSAGAQADWKWHGCSVAHPAPSLDGSSATCA